MLAAKRNNYLAAAVLGRDAVGLAYADITTGEFACTQLHAAEPETALLQELARVQPAEVLVETEAPERMGWRRRPTPAHLTPDPSPTRRGERRREGQAGEDGREEDNENPVDGGVGARLVSSVSPRQDARPHSAVAVDSDDAPDDAWDLASRISGAGSLLSTAVTPYDPRAFKEETARERLREQFGVATLEAFGCEKLPLAVRAAGAVVAYLRETQRDTLAQITALETYSVSGFMTLDAHTRRNLELFESGRAVGARVAAVGAGRDAHADGRATAAQLAGPATPGRSEAERPARRRADALADSTLRARLTPLSTAWATWSG